jgi:hypothetical protein
MKLTYGDKRSIKARVLTDTFELRTSQLVKRRQALAVRVILKRYGKDAFKRFAAVPAGWLMPVSRFLVKPHNAGNRSTFEYLHLGETRPMPAELYLCDAIELDPQLTSELQEICEAELALRRDREQLEVEIVGVLAGFNTEAQLRNGWPEGYACLRRPSPPVPGVPVLRVEDLNRRIEILKEAV